MVARPKPELEFVMGHMKGQGLGSTSSHVLIETFLLPMDGFGDLPRGSCLFDRLMCREREQQRICLISNPTTGFGFDVFYSVIVPQRHRHCTYNIILRRVLATIVGVEQQ